MLSSSGVWRVGCLAALPGQVEVHVDGDPLARGRALGQALDRGGRPVFVERGRAQLDDQRAQAGDLLGQVLDGGLDRRAQLLLAAAPGRRQPDAQAGEALQRLVVQLAGPAPALLLGGLDALAQPLLLDRLAGGHRRRRAGRERAEEALVLAVEAASSPRWSKAASTPTERPRNASGTSSAVSASRPSSSCEMCSAERASVSRSERCDRSTWPVHRPLDRHLLAVGARRELAGAGREHELLLLLEHDHQRAGAHERPRPLDDQLEDAARGSSPRRAPARSPPPCRARAPLARGRSRRRSTAV